MQDNDQRQNIKKDYWLIIMVLIAVFILIITDFGQGRTVVYDCRDAHWLPDVPVEVKKECQRIHYEEWKKQQEEANKKIIKT